MHVHVSVGDTGSAGDLIRLLLGEFDAESVSFDAERGTVSLDARGNPDRALVRALDLIELWVTDFVGMPTTVDVDGRSYTLEPSASVAGRR